jgi:hypothetical protein
MEGRFCGEGGEWGEGAIEVYKRRRAVNEGLRFCGYPSIHGSMEFAGDLARDRESNRNYRIRLF